jgi:hypothetical protein
LRKPLTGVAYSEHETVEREAMRAAACRQGVEGIISKRIDAPPRRATAEYG